MPALEVRLEPFPGKFGGPRFLGHFIRLHESNEIKQSAGAQVVGYSGNVILVPRNSTFLPKFALFADGLIQARMA